ncbi:type I secretion system permease/ATPase [Chlorobaculum thiosulfatiphilum]|uniref:Type I secretion system permease/ATPase n=1 Tax=Chlorobaculum thiosulfatiphilum TaxID=115852 RepID=A0A5C4S044_CHLTI|nr:type I secretion system permease/ATPase [Chlorobaculum thiosulfatiphilum]TNJ36558.1 type I secretion system permease/ATPase [Chlorobaculum thiosulfatiphilum]
MVQPDKKSEVREALYSLSPWVIRALLFSIVTNILVLTPSGYMLEVYDRVINSRNHQTLVMLTILVVGLYVMLEALEWVRSGIMHEAARAFDERLRRRVFDTAFAARLKNLPVGSAAQVVADLKTVRDIIGAHVTLSFMDAPLALLVLIILFLMHPLLGWFSVIGALIQVLIGVFNERRIKRPMMLASRGSTGSQMYAGSVLRNAQVIRSMGMLGNMRKRWLAKQREFLASQADASDTASANASLSKLVQSLLSSSLLGIGCWLTLEGNLGGSGMIVGSILGGKVLAPLVQIIANWRQVEGAREAFARLDGMLKAFPAEEERMPLPPPKGQLSVEGVIAGAPGSQAQILKGIGFRVAPGDSLAVVGPSASGKTTLARLLTGVWSPMSGKVRLDGSDVATWNKEELGPHVGYLPQAVELFDGTIAENVARFGEPDADKVRAACRMVGLEAFIATLPKGYDTPVGDDGAFLSGGQRQRVALARAVYGMPRFVVLDEPNSNLDTDGDAALIDTLRQLKAAGTTVIAMTHRMNILQSVGYMLVLIDGQIKQFGPRDQVLSALKGEQPPKPQTSSKPQPQQPRGISLNPAPGGQS